ncbi:MAG TPA: hypothetical protein PKH77_25980 [Anaerolineae bacterium]|nr:hypothetical protein [Anaerolineae bacterium]
MNTQLSLFAAPASAPLPAPTPTRKTPWPLTLRVNREQNYALLTSDKAPFATQLLLQAARSVGLPVRDNAVLIAPVGYTALGDIGGEFLKYLARQHPDRELQVWRTTVTETNPAPAEAAPQLDPKTLTAPRSRGNSKNRSTNRSQNRSAPPEAAPEPPSKLAALAQADPGHILVVCPAPVAPEPYAPPIARAARHTWPVNLTVYANGQTVITAADWGLELFRQTATRHNYPTDGNAVVTVVRRADEQLPWEEANVRLDDRAAAFIADLPHTKLHWYFELRDLPLPERYAPASPDSDVPEDEDRPTGWDHVYVIDCEDTRADLLTAGDLVDVTATAHEAGFKIPVAVTRALWAVIEDIPPAHSYQSERGRLWDLVSMAYLAARRNPDADAVHFRLIMHHQNRVYLDVAMRCGPGDDAAPVITLLLTDEE